MKITQEELKTMIREAIASRMTEQGNRKPTVTEASSIAKDVLPGSGDMAKFAKQVDEFLQETAEKAKELCEKMEDEMKTDVLGGENPSLAPRVGERNRMLSTRIGVLKKLAANCTSIFEFIRREG